MVEQAGRACRPRARSIPHSKQSLVTGLERYGETHVTPIDVASNAGGVLLDATARAPRADLPPYLWEAPNTIACALPGGPVRAILPCWAQRAPWKKPRSRTVGTI